MKYLVIALALLASPASAQSSCAAHVVVKSYLDGEYGETPKATGIAENGSGFEIYANERSGTFTVVITVDGMSCIVAHGSRFKAVGMAL